jgi:hypothetical protein
MVSISWYIFHIILTVEIGMSLSNTAAITDILGLTTDIDLKVNASNRI